MQSAATHRLPPMWSGSSSRRWGQVRREFPIQHRTSHSSRAEILKLLRLQRPAWMRGHRWALHCERHSFGRRRSSRERPRRRRPRFCYTRVSLRRGCRSGWGRPGNSSRGGHETPRAHRRRPDWRTCQGRSHRWVNSRMRDDLCVLQLLRCESNGLPRHRLPAAEGVRGHCGRGDGPVCIVHVLNICDVDDVCDVSNVRDVHHSHVVFATVVPRKEWFAWPQRKPCS